MTGTAPSRCRRTDTGLFLVAQVALVFAALVFMPFGARDGSGVSDVLPALHPVPAETPRTVHALVGATASRDVPTAPVARATVAAALLGATAPVAVRRRVAVARPGRQLGRCRPGCVGPLGGRAPPLLR